MEVGSSGEDRKNLDGVFKNLFNPIKQLIRPGSVSKPVRKEYKHDLVKVIGFVI